MGVKKICLFNKKIVRKIWDEGEIYHMKIDPIKHARRLKNTNEWCIVNFDGVESKLTDKEFNNLYEEDCFGDIGYKARVKKIIALKNPFNQEIEINLSDNNQENLIQLGGKKSFIAISVNSNRSVSKNRYFFKNKKALLSICKETLESYRHIDGKDKAIKRIGSHKKRGQLISMVKNPDRYSRNALIDSVILNYSGAVYGDEHNSRTANHWGGPNHGKEYVTLYGQFRNIYPQLEQLILDPGFMNHLSDFMELAKEQDFSKHSAQEVRDFMKNFLGTKEVYRGMTLTQCQAEKMKVDGILASIPRGIDNSNKFIEKVFEAVTLSVSLRDMNYYHFNAGADNSTLISVSERKVLAASLGKEFGNHGDGKKTYLVKMNIPVIDLMYWHNDAPGGMSKEIESFVFWKINPEEIISIEEVTDDLLA